MLLRSWGWHIRSLEQISLLSNGNIKEVSNYPVSNERQPGLWAVVSVPDLARTHSKLCLILMKNRWYVSSRLSEDRMSWSDPAWWSCCESVGRELWVVLSEINYVYFFCKWLHYSLRPWDHCAQRCLFLATSDSIGWCGFERGMIPIQKQGAKKSGAVQEINQNVTVFKCVPQRL